MEYNNLSAAWLWTNEWKLQSRIETIFLSDLSDKESQYPLTPCTSRYKFQDYCRWVTNFILSVLVLTTAVEPTKQRLVLVFTIILLLQCLDAIWQLYNKYRSDRNKLVGSAGGTGTRVDTPSKIAPVVLGGKSPIIAWELKSQDAPRSLHLMTQNSPTGACESPTRLRHLPNVIRPCDYNSNNSTQEAM